MKIKSPFFVSMATAAKFVQLIPIFLAYLVPLDVDVAQPQEIHCQPRRITKNDPKLSNCTIKLYFW
jgi:hypothetical protein